MPARVATKLDDDHTARKDRCTMIPTQQRGPHPSTAGITITIIAARCNEWILDAAGSADGRHR